MKCWYMLALAAGLSLGASAQNVGVGENNPKSRLEIKAATDQPDSNAVMVRNSAGDSLFQINNAGTVKIGSKTRDFGSLEILNDGALYHNLLLRGTNFAGNSGRFFADLLFTDETGNRYWRMASRIYGPDAGTALNTTANSWLNISNDSLSNVLVLTGSGRLALNNSDPQAMLQISADWQNTNNAAYLPHIRLVGTGLASRVIQDYTNSDGTSIWRVMAQHGPSGISGSYYTIQLDANPAAGFTLYGDARALLGIGASSARLNINADASPTNPTLILFESENSDYTRLQMQNSGGSDYWEMAGLVNNTTPSNSKLSFRHPAVGSVLTLTGDGKVSIGNTLAPTSYLHIVANSSSTATGPFQLLLEETQADYARIGFRNTNGDGWQIAGYVDATAANSQLNFWSSQTNRDVLSLRGDGSACFYGNVKANVVSTCSDIRFKTRIDPLAEAMPIVNRLQPVYYNWNKTASEKYAFDDHRQLGFIAQDVEKILPEVVYTDDEGYKSIDYGKFTPLLLKAVQELNSRIELLEAENAKMREELKELLGKRDN